MKCALCGEERPLIKAHVVPRSFYDLPRHGEQSAKVLSNTLGSHPKKSQSGIYFEGKLCSGCDSGCLGSLDQHAGETLLNGNRLRHSIMSFQYPDADPDRIKRFAVSMLWRAALAGKPYFSRVRLGPYQDAIKQSLVDGSELADIDVAVAEFDAKLLDFMDPFSTRFEGVLVWVFYANRFIFYIKTSKLPMPRHLKPVTLRTGDVVTTVIRQWTRSKELGVAQSIVKANPSAFKRIAS